MKQAYTLSVLERNGVSEVPRLDEVGFYIPKKSWGVYNDNNYPRNIQLGDYAKWEQEMLNKPNAVTSEEIVENPKEYVFRCDFYELKYLFDVQPPKGSIYIKSVTEPFDEEMEIEKSKADNWLKLFNLYPYKQLHCSGHASGAEIQDMIQKIAGVEIAQVYLCHTPKTLAEKSYTKPHFERLAAALDIMREQLQPMFDNVPIYPRIDIR